MEYNADYFLNKFLQIPESKWCTGSYTNLEGQHCGIGHCMGDYTRVTQLPSDHEASCLIELFITYLKTVVVGVNDGHYPERFPQSTPKKRIIAALLQIKAQEQKVEISEPPITAEELISSLPAIKILEEV